MFDEIYENRYKEYRLRQQLRTRDGIEIYSGDHVYTGEKVMIKLEPVLNKLPKLSYENKIFSSLKNLRELIRELLQSPIVQ